MHYGAPECPRLCAGRHGRHTKAVGDLHAGLSAGGLGDASLCRGAVCAPQLGASSRPGSTLRLERSWCRSRVLSGLARDVRTWQAVVAVGIEVHLWRMEVRLRRPPLVRAQPRPASLERAPPDFPPEMLAVVRGPPLAPAPLLTLPSSIRRCRAPPARPPAPPPSAPRSPPPSPPPPASFSTTLCSSRGCAAAPGGYEAASRAACSVTTATLAALAAWQRGSYL